MPRSSNDPKYSTHAFSLPIIAGILLVKLYVAIVYK